MTAKVTTVATTKRGKAAVVGRRSQADVPREMVKKSTVMAEIWADNGAATKSLVKATLTNGATMRASAVRRPTTVIPAYLGRDSEEPDGGGTQKKRPKSHIGLRSEEGANVVPKASNDAFRRDLFRKIHCIPPPAVAK